MEVDTDRRPSAALAGAQLRETCLYVMRLSCQPAGVPVFFASSLTASIVVPTCWSAFFFLPALLQHQTPHHLDLEAVLLRQDLGVHGVFFINR